MASLTLEYFPKSFPFAAIHLYVDSAHRTLRNTLNNGVHIGIMEKKIETVILYPIILCYALLYYMIPYYTTYSIITLNPKP